MLEKYLIEHCAPTLASLKTASLFTCAREPGWEEQLHKWRHQLGGRGIELLVLQKRRNTALIYVYRRERLRQDLLKPGVGRFLAAYGYLRTDPDEALERLKQRLEESERFPHEIGLFLGYPLGDVIGFIDNAGRNCKCTGCWKVYCNECETMRTFAKFRKCREVYSRLWQQGRSVLQLTVAA